MSLQSSQPIGVIGAGSWGTTVAHIVGNQDHPTLLWARDHDLVDEINTHHTNQRYLSNHELSANIQATSDLQEVLSQCQLLLVLVPSKGFRSVCHQMGDFLRGDHCVIHGTKGLEEGTHKRMSEILKEETCIKKIGVLSGPNLAREIMKGDPAGTVVASHYNEVIQQGKRAMSCNAFRVYSNHDVVGVELGGSLKNIFAIASGILTGIKLGDNAKSLLMTRGLAEMSRIGKALGADPITFSGLAGIGDLIVTCSSHLSRNFQVGYRLSQGESLQEITDSMFMVAEGVKTTNAMVDLAREMKVQMPLTQCVGRILSQGDSPSTLLESLMIQSAEYEVDGLVR